MPSLSSIPGIEDASLELLEAAGFHNAESIAKADVDLLSRELERANSILKIAERAPDRSSVEQWVATARDLTGIEERPGEAAAAAVNLEENPEVAAMLAAAPFAIPLPARLLVENQLGVSDIPSAVFLNRCAGDLNVKAADRLPKTKQPKAAALSNFVRIAEEGGQRREIDTSKLRSTENLGDAKPRVAAVKTSPAEDRIALLRAPRSTTNKGRDPQSRWYIRGVLHSHPLSIYFGALVTLLLMIVAPLAVVSAALLLLSAQVPEHFGWVPGWLLAFPVVLPAFGIAYLVWGLGGGCRICGQKLFVHRSHLKNSRAHHVRGLGYVFPLCVQILVFRWFRCTHCGTPVRLKE